MKLRLFTIKYFLILFFFSIPINAQILNGGFENWTNNFNPDNWISNNSFVYISVSKSIDKHSGQYALKGEVVNFDSSSIPPILYGGGDGQGFTVSKRYASLEGYYKFSPVNGDRFNIVIMMYKGNFPLTVLDTNLSSSSAYTKFSLPINYSTPDIPDRLFIEAIISDTTNTVPAHIGSNFLLDDIELTGESVTGVTNAVVKVPGKFKVYQNYPNPFNPSTTIRYSIPEAVNVAINIYDIGGNLILTLINNKQSPGTYEVTWNGKNNKGIPVVSGIYLYKIQAGNLSKISKMVLLK
jgi:FlgD Ig-like domain